MGMGLLMDCPECKEQYSFNFGCGYLFFQNHTKKVLYFCPKCGNWETKDIKTNKMFKDSKANIAQAPKEKRHILSCSKCKTRMRKMEDFNAILAFLVDSFTNSGKSSELINSDFNSEKLPSLVCKKCNTELKYKSTYCWD